MYCCNAGLLPWMVDLAFRNSQAANVTTVVRGGVSADDSIATLELAIDKVRFLKTHYMLCAKTDIKLTIQTVCGHKRSLTGKPAKACSCAFYPVNRLLR